MVETRTKLACLIFKFPTKLKAKSFRFSESNKPGVGVEPTAAWRKLPQFPFFFCFWVFIWFFCCLGALFFFGGSWRVDVCVSLEFLRSRLPADLLGGFSFAFKFLF
jgi:hypothetical protein